MTTEQKNRAAVALGRLGGKGRAKKLTKEQRVAIARKGAQARWEGHETPAKPAKRKRRKAA